MWDKVAQLLRGTTPGAEHETQVRNHGAATQPINRSARDITA
jgi:hypothetical protein